MISHRWISERLVLAALLFGLAAPLLAGPGWTVHIDTADVTRAADPEASGEVLLIDVAALAPSLGLTVRVDGTAVTIRDSAAGEWRGSAGSSILSGPLGDVPLARPVRIDSRSVYLPAVTAAALAGLTLLLDPVARSAVFARTGAVSADGMAPPGWAAFTVARPPDSPTRIPSSVYDSGLPTVLPSDHDTVRLGVTAGHAGGADSTLDVTGNGDIRGFDTRFGGFVNQSLQGTQLSRGFFHLYQPQGFGLETGDLFTEIWGSAQGLRLLGKERDDGGSRPALSLYVLDGQDGGRQTVLAGYEELDFGGGTVAGEAASNGSWLLRARYKNERFGLFAYGRDAAGVGPAQGASGSIELPAGIILNAGWNSTGRGADAISGENASLRLPVLHRADLSLEATSTRSDRTRLIAEAVNFTSPLGPVFLHARYQLNNGSYLQNDGGWARFGRRDLLASLSYSLSSRLRFEVSGMSRAPLQGDAARWAQLGVAWKILPTTSLQILLTSSGAPSLDPVHLGIQQLLGNGFTIFGEVGRIASFQGDSTVPGEAAQWRLSVRKMWDVQTPPGGGLVEGTVSTSVGRLGANLPVELGPYRTTTDASGGFAFHNVPPGSYPLAVPRQALPAAYLAPSAESVDVAARHVRHVDLPLVPLCVVSGRVYVDHGDGRHGAEAGLAGIVVWLDDEVTATGPDGAFEFHNIKPGTHRLSLDVGRLPADVAATVPSSLDIGLPPGGRLDGVELRLVPRSKPVVFQELLR